MVTQNEILDALEPFALAYEKWLSDGRWPISNDTNDEPHERVSTGDFHAAANVYRSARPKGEDAS